jgi:hypothetical protein
MLESHPYKYSSDDVFFQVFANRNDLTEAEYDQARKEFFSKGQACFRASPLTKTNGFGVLLDSNGKVALLGMETEEYAKAIHNLNVKKVKAMRSSKK